MQSIKYNNSIKPQNNDNKCQKQLKVVNMYKISPGERQLMMSHDEFTEQFMF